MLEVREEIVVTVAPSIRMVHPVPWPSKPDKVFAALQPRR